ncbi:putative NADH kinase isoform X3 [Canna indica]|uniref:NADH kinase n=1 Tax=Canna indica TaxID=4628 RepID=A0AAQ3JTJ5_9LILI|nr:putative NADH kinase isoform X3 [Canna indica]
MATRRVLLLLKPLDVSPPKIAANHPPNIINYLNSRYRGHKDAIKYCQDVLQHKFVDLEPVMRDNLCHPIRHVDLVITIGGDGTLLHASHFLDDSIPILGVNSDPTRIEEVNELSNEFDATRSTGYLCAATTKNFEQVLDDLLEGHKQPSQISRISITINGKESPMYALNDILVAHSCPAMVSRFSFRIQGNNKTSSRLVHSRSSGLRVSTAAGSTAAMLAGGGSPMPILSQDLQYMVREPISPRAAEAPLMHGFVKPDQSMLLEWYTQEGAIYVDGGNVAHSLQYGDRVEISAKAPVLKAYLPQDLLRDSSPTSCQPRSAL